MTKAELRTYIRQLYGDRRSPYNLNDTTLDVNIKAAITNFVTDVGIPTSGDTVVLSLVTGQSDYPIPDDSSGFIPVLAYFHRVDPLYFYGFNFRFILNENYRTIRVDPVPTKDEDVEVAYWKDYTAEYDTAAEDDPLSIPSEFLPCIARYTAYLSYQFADIDVRNQRAQQNQLEQYMHMMGQMRALVNDLASRRIEPVPNESYIIDGRSYDYYKRQPYNVF